MTNSRPWTSSGPSCSCTATGCSARPRKRWPRARRARPASAARPVRGRLRGRRRDRPGGAVARGRALEMPPLATWFSGRETVLGHVASNLGATAGRMRLVPAAANGQPAFAAYLRVTNGVYRAHAMIVLTLAANWGRATASSSSRPCSACSGSIVSSRPAIPAPRTAATLILASIGARANVAKVWLRSRQRLARPGPPVVGGPQDHGARAGLAAGDAVKRPWRQRGLRLSRKARIPSRASGSWLVAAMTSIA